MCVLVCVEERLGIVVEVFQGELKKTIRSDRTGGILRNSHGSWSWQGQL